MNNSRQRNGKNSGNSSFGHNNSSTVIKNQNHSQSMSKRKQKLTQQSIQQFKVQIDHQIAKCLDVLDRQGLKYIRQTMKTSNIFSSKNLDEVQQQANQYNRSPKTKQRNLNQKSKSKLEPGRIQNQKSKIQIQKNNKNYLLKNNLQKQKHKNVVQKQQKIQKSNKSKQTKHIRSNSVKNINSKKSTKNNKLPAKNSNNKNQSPNKQYQTEHQRQRQLIEQEIEINDQSKSNVFGNKNQQSGITIPNYSSNTNNQSILKSNIILKNQQTNQQINVNQSLGSKINKKLAQYHINKNGPTQKAQKQRNIQSANSNKVSYGSNNRKNQQEVGSKKVQKVQTKYNNKQKSEVLKEQVPQTIQEQVIVEEIQQNISLINKKQSSSPPKINSNKKISPTKNTKIDNNSNKNSRIVSNNVSNSLLSPQKPIKLQQIKNPLKSGIKQSAKNLVKQQIQQLKSHNENKQKSKLPVKQAKNVSIKPSNNKSKQQANQMPNKKIQEKQHFFHQSIGMKIDNTKSNIYGLQEEIQEIQDFNTNQKEKYKQEKKQVLISNYENENQRQQKNQAQQVKERKLEPFQNSPNNFSEETDNKQSRITLQSRQNQNTSSKQPSIFINKLNNSKKKDKKQKASVINTSHSKSASRSRIKIDFDVENQQQPNNSDVLKVNMIQKKDEKVKYEDKKVQDLQELKVNNILKEQKVIKMEKIDFKQIKNEILSPSLPQQRIFQKVQIKQGPKKQEKLQNFSSNEVKMMNLNKNKSMSKSPQRSVTHVGTQLKFVIISNRGHKTLFGLTGIQLFTIDYKKVTLTQPELKQNQISTGKLIQLFNKKTCQTTNQEKMFKSYMANNTIVVNLNQANSKIGGIKIFNFNKSSLESDKEVNQIEIYHDGDKIWKGQLLKGSYTQNQDYSTKIDLIPNFKFQKTNFVENNLSISIKSKGRGGVVSAANPMNWNTADNSIKLQENESGMKKSLVSQRRSAVQIAKNQISQNETSYKKQDISIPQTFVIPQIKKVDKEVYENNAFKELSSLRQKSKKQTTSVNSIQKNKYGSKKTDYDDFDETLKGLQKNVNREKSKSKLPPSIPIGNITPNNPYSQQKSSSPYQNKNSSSLTRSYSQKNQFKPPIQLIKNQKNQKVEDDFMNDSLFHQKPQRQRINSAEKKSPAISVQQKVQEQKYRDVQEKEIKRDFSKNATKSNDVNIDDFLGQLEDMMGKKNTVSKKVNVEEKDFSIPNLPQGKVLQIEIYQNWGHPAFVGLKGIQFFDQKGKPIVPSNIKSDKNIQNIDLLKNINIQNLMLKDQVIQIKLNFSKSQKTKLTIQFNDTKTLSLIRIWNYYGHRINSNIGIKYCSIKLNNKNIFMGQLKKNQNSPQNFYKSFEPILFTNNNKVLTFIKENDWINEIKRKIKEEKQLLKSTLLNFNRPKTRNNQESGNEKNFKKKQLPEKQIKIPKIRVWQFEPPTLPKGNVITFLLYNTWGSTDFIGLNGIQIFDKNGNVIGKQNISSIKAFPNSTGEKNDKRVVENLINGNNFSHADQNIWLSAYQSDLQKLETGKSNSILIQLSKSTVISGINIYNYSKTPDRGVRQIQIQMNGYLLFRGYLKIFSSEDNQNSVHTTINFTNTPDILKKMYYEAYTQDKYDQNVQFINQRKRQVNK